MEKIILFYLFTPLKDLNAVLLWQKKLGESNQLTGRIIISKHGINGTLGGPVDKLKTYIKENKLYLPFKDIKYKWSDGGNNDFPKLSVKIRSEIVTFGLTDSDLKVTKKGLKDGGKHLSPKEVHKLVESRPKDVVFFDGRNQYEAWTGRFKNAVIPKVNYTREFSSELQKDEYKDLKNKAVITYCTGGIRCEVLTVMMKKNGFKEVYQIDGGIDNYGKTYGDDGLWEGSLYTFDRRMGMKFSSKAKDIAVCSSCNNKTSNYENCANKSCNKLIILCSKCAENSIFCSSNCKQEVEVSRL